MATATLSSKYQLAIPKAIRDELGLKPGQQFTVMAKGDNIELIPVRTIGSARGIFQGTNSENYRDRGE